MRERSVAPQVGEVRFMLAVPTDSPNKVLSAIGAYLSDPSTRLGFFTGSPSVDEPPSLAGVAVLRERSVARGGFRSAALILARRSVRVRYDAARASEAAHLASSSAAVFSASAAASASFLARFSSAEATAALMSATASGASSPSNARLMSGALGSFSCWM